MTCRRHAARRWGLLVALLPLLGLLAACDMTPNAAPASAAGPAATLRLGYFGNITQATPLIALNKGFFAREVGATKLAPQAFNAGPSAVEALFSGSIDAAYIGPSPAVTGYVRSHGEALRIVAGAASGGASLVVRKGINDVAGLRGAKLGTPQLGNTQDVALRSYLAGKGLRANVNGGGDVTVEPMDNAQILGLFRQGKLDGAWVPEPWASQLVLTGGGHVLVDERTLWPRGQFATTLLVVNTSYLHTHPETVRALLRGQLAAERWATANPDQAKAAANAQLPAAGGKTLPATVLDRAWSQITLTDDPLASTVAVQARHAVAVKLLTAPNLEGVFDLTQLNAVRHAAGEPAVSDGGLGARGAS